MNDLDSAAVGYAELASEAANEGRGWEPIRTSDDGFTGRFDGQGHEIRDLSIYRPGQDYVGLFAHISWTRSIDNIGVVENTGMVNAEVTGASQAGTHAGHNGGIMSNCYPTGRVMGSRQVGGLVGVNCYGNVTRSYSTGSVRGTTQTGGLVGYNAATLSDSFWDIETSGQSSSAGGTGKTTTEMKTMATFSGAGCNSVAVANPSTRDPAYIWNTVDGVTYPFLSWHP